MKNLLNGTGANEQQASCFDTGGDSGLSDWRVVFSVLVLVYLYEIEPWGAKARMIFASVWEHPVAPPVNVAPT